MKPDDKLSQDIGIHESPRPPQAGSANRFYRWLAAGIAALAMAGLGIWANHFLASPGRPSLQSATLLPNPRPIPDFALVTDSGAFTQQDLLGHWTLVFAGFTYCPEVCPTTLARLKEAKALLGTEAAKRLLVLFVSVDPARDTPERLGHYARHFDPSFRGATASEAQLQALLAALGLVYLKQDEPGGAAPLIDHSAHVVIVNPAGKLAGYLIPPFTAEGLAADMKALLGANPP